MNVGNPSKRVYDEDVIGKNAENAAERRKVLRVAVNQRWADKDIGLIRRDETGRRFFYGMWQYPRGAMIAMGDG